jgi:hypothetical protein
LPEEEKEWRARILEEVVGIRLEWYMNSGFVKTKVHKRILDDALDIVMIMSSGKSWKQKKERAREFFNAL